MKGQFWRLLLVLLVLVMVPACQGDAPSVVLPSPEEEESPSETSPTISPSPPTETVSAPLAIFLTPPETDPDLKTKLAPMISGWADAPDLRFQTREVLTEADFGRDDVRWVVALPPAENLTELANKAPETRFLAVGFSELEAADNLSVILPERIHYDQHGFLAGYIAAMITPDWRVGVISLAENEAGAAARDGFLTGVRYFCGLCQIEYPPYFSYPLYVEAAEGATPDQWQAAASLLIKKSVETIYLVPGAGDEALYRYLSQQDVELIGGVLDIPDANEGQWVVSLRFDLQALLESYAPGFLAGEEPGEVLSIPLVMEDPNSRLFSPGRQKEADRILKELQDGYIDLD
jgi:hypothetical protein